MKADLKATDSRRNNAEECISHLGEEKSPNQNSRQKVK